jgi:hypothetical protein
LAWIVTIKEEENYSYLLHKKDSAMKKLLLFGLLAATPSAEAAKYFLNLMNSTPYAITFKANTSKGCHDYGDLITLQPNQGWSTDEGCNMSILVPCNQGANSTWAGDARCSNVTGARSYWNDASGYNFTEIQTRGGGPQAGGVGDVNFYVYEFRINPMTKAMELWGLSGSREAGMTPTWKQVPVGASA